MPFVAVAALYLGMHIYSSSFFFKIPCVFNKATGYLCAGCGGTRALSALLRGEIWLSFRSNPFLLFAALLLTCLYLQLLFSAFGRKIKIVPESSAFLYGTLGTFLAFYVLRNFIPLLQIP